jgi:hypothetical protein
MNIETANWSTQADSMYCVQYNPSDTSAYYRASNFTVGDNGGGILANGAIHIPNAYDVSHWSDIGAYTQNGNDGFFIEAGCCGAGMDHVFASTGPNTSAGNAVPWRFGDLMPLNNITLTAGNCTITSTSFNFLPGYVGWDVDFISGTGSLGAGTTVTAWNPGNLPLQTGGNYNAASHQTIAISPCPTASGAANLQLRKPVSTNFVHSFSLDHFTANGAMPGFYNIVVDGVVSGLSLENGYLEATSTNNDPFIFIAQNSDSISLSNIDTENALNTSKYAVDNFSASTTFHNIRTSAGIHDEVNNVIELPTAGTCPYCTVTNYDTSQTVAFAGSSFVTRIAGQNYNFGFANNGAFNIHGALLDNLGAVAWGSGGSGTTGAIDTVLYRMAPGRLNLGTTNTTGSNSGALWLQLVNYNPQTFGQLPACDSATAPEGSEEYIVDATVNTPGTVVAGGGTYRLKVLCTNVAWVVE